MAKNPLNDMVNDGDDFQTDESYSPSDGLYTQ